MIAKMKRREFITLLGGAAAAWPIAARAQQQGERVRRIGILMNLAADDPEGQAPASRYPCSSARRARRGQLHRAVPLRTREDLIGSRQTEGAV